MEVPLSEIFKEHLFIPIMAKQTDEQLMEQVSQGNLDKLSVLFDRYQVPLYNFFYRQNYNGAVSEDLTQTVFERILKYRQSYVPGMTFRSWIFQIARNAKTDYHKKQQKISDFIEIENIEDCTATIVGSNIAEEHLYQLDWAMAKLPAAHREILVMTRFQKMKYKEVAAILQCTEGAVKVKVHRAIKELRVIFFKK